jgi:hypothetical protein
LSNSIRLRDERAQAGDIAAWMRQRGDHADAQRLSEGGHDDGDGRGGGFRGPRCRRSAGHDQVDAVAHQLRDELAETLPFAVGRAVLDVEVLPLHVSELTQPVEQRRKVLLVLCPVGRFSRTPMA